MIHAKQKAYRQANKDRLKTYQEMYRRKKGIPKRVFKERGLGAPRRERVVNALTRVLNEHIECVGCEAKVRKGSDQYFDGRMREGEFWCVECGVPC